MVSKVRPVDQISTGRQAPNIILTMLIPPTLSVSYVKLDCDWLKHIISCC